MTVKACHGVIGVFDSVVVELTLAEFMRRRFIHTLLILDLGINPYTTKS